MKTRKGNFTGVNTGKNYGLFTVLFEKSKGKLPTDKIQLKAK